MATAKDIVLKPIDAHTAREFIKRVHYSGKVAQNSQIHIGAFLNDKLEGVMQFGPSLDKRKIQGLVRGTGWNEFLELNRMAFTDALPRNSESRAIGIAMRLLRQHAPHLKWVISFADGTQCGDGTIYRASGFVLTGIVENKNLALDENGNAHHKMTYESNPINTGYTRITGGKNDWGTFISAKGWTRSVGFQLRYLYFIDPTARERLTVPILPFSEIEKRGAGMYKGEKITRATAEKETGGISNVDTGGANPTVALKHDKQEKNVGAYTDKKARASANKR